MKTFEDFKNYIVEKATELNACDTELLKAKNAINFKELFQVIKDNINWSISNKLINTDILLNYVDDTDLVANGFYVKKQNVIQKEKTCYYFSSTSEHYDNSTSEHYDNSTSEHYGSSTSKHYDSSTSKHYFSSTSKHYGSSTSEHYDNSTSEHYGSSTSKHYGSSTSKHYFSSTSEHYDNSTYGNVFILNDTSTIKGKAIIRERSTNKLYFNKNAFEIVEIE
jgi:hypothetical protein